jgi:predicted metalloendopeptidase
LKIDESDDFLTMVFKAKAFEHAREVKEMNHPTDRDKWFMTPQTVNAYYHPSLNEIVFPAAILQPPFFNSDADDAVNYGAMGAVVGHEMTHGFDDKGRKFDSEGNMHDWWSEDDAKEYEKRVDVMVSQANSFKVYDQAVQGKLTCGENIADSGGVLLALRALKNSKDYNLLKSIDGFTPVQRFFLSWAQAWRQNITKERSLQLLTLDPHGPNEMRCNLPLSNITEFHKAFEVPEGSPMWKPVESRVDIW